MLYPLPFFFCLPCQQVPQEFDLRRHRSFNIQAAHQRLISYVSYIYANILWSICPLWGCSLFIVHLNCLFILFIFLKERKLSTHDFSVSFPTSGSESHLAFLHRSISKSDVPHLNTCEINQRIESIIYIAQLNVSQKWDVKLPCQTDVNRQINDKRHIEMNAVLSIFVDHFIISRFLLLLLSLLSIKYLVGYYIFQLRMWPTTNRQHDHSLFFGLSFTFKHKRRKLSHFWCGGKKRALFKNKKSLTIGSQKKRGECAIDQWSHYTNVLAAMQDKRAAANAFLPPAHLLILL